MTTTEFVVPPWFIVLLSHSDSSSKRGATLPNVECHAPLLEELREAVRSTTLFPAITGLPVGFYSSEHFEKCFRIFFPMLWSD
jgi:hypothetical protein